jgi:hypothetical protein
MKSNKEVEIKPTDALIYVINVDERGEFFADVRKTGSGESIFEIRGFDIFEDGWMKNKTDLNGLHQYLVHFGIITESNPLDLLK